jgi:hypothetical protein
MSLSSADLKYVEDGLARIDASVTYGHAATEPQNHNIKATLEPQVIINNTAYHDYNRIELGTPVIATKVVDKKLRETVVKVVEMTELHPSWFSDAARTSRPTDADTVEELIAEMKADLANMAAGPVPGIVQTFVVEALADYIDQAVWTAMSSGERDRLGQLASSWASLSGRTATGSSSQSGSGSGSNSNDGGGGLLDFLNPFNLL